MSTSTLEHEHRHPHLAHHFATPEQQFESGKLGMWVFLATEILMFGGLFCAYSVYRANHPEIFIYAHQYLDKILGGINTVILICSSLTMAWAVRAAQLDQRRTLIVCLILTLLGGAGFMGIKYVEYKSKWEHGLLWGKYYQPRHEAHGKGAVDAAGGDPRAAQAGEGSPESHARTGDLPSTAGLAPAAGGGQAAAADGPQAAVPDDPDAPKIRPAAMGPPGLAYPATLRDPHLVSEPHNVRLFFSVYFAMTGLHGFHVLVGMGLLAWILIRSVKGHFSSSYFLPVDLVGLYWHLVDLIWIFLFPLLYLIH